jgi:hypothetical protein
MSASLTTPKASAKATAKAALDESPDPRGKVEVMCTRPPKAGRASETMAAARRAHAGSQEATAFASMSSGTEARSPG